MTDISESGLEAAISSAIFDPGAEVGMKHDRTLTQWQTDAVMNVLMRFHPPASREEGLREALAAIKRIRADDGVIYSGPVGGRAAALNSAEEAIEALIPTKPEAGEPDYLVWSNEHRQWWRPDRSGYTTSIHAAGRYPRSEALRLAKSARNGWGAYGNPDEIAVPLADALLCMPDAAREALREQS